MEESDFDSMDMDHLDRLFDDLCNDIDEDDPSESIKLNYNIMKKGTDIGVKDCNKQPLKIGDIVMSCWGMNKNGLFCRFHKLRYSKKDKMILLGNCYNEWEGKDVEKISYKKWKETGIELEEMFYYIEGKCIKFNSKNHPDKEIQNRIDISTITGFIIT